MIIFFALGMGVFAFATWTAAFVLFSCGYMVYEPNILVAIIEACFAGSCTVLSIIAFLLYIKKKDAYLSKGDIVKGYNKLMDEINKGGTE